MIDIKNKPRKNLLCVPKYLLLILSIYTTSTFYLNKAYGQPEVAPWGNFNGIRVQGQLMEFESNIVTVENDWSKVKATGKERQRPKYIREGQKQIITTSIDSLTFKEIVEDSAAGIANVNFQVTAKAGVKMQGVYFKIGLPLKDYFAGDVLAGETLKTKTKFTGLKEDLKLTAKEVQFISSQRTLILLFDEPTQIIIRKETDTINKAIEVYISILSEEVQSGITAQKKFTIKASGYIDKRKITLALDASKPGREFDGLGGNFRIQNPKTDPQVIDYCLQNLRVAWGRIEMPWRFWQPDKDTAGDVSAANGKLNIRVQQAMEMAQRLGKMNIPIILSAWFPPRWAISGELNFRPKPNGVWGNPLDTNNINEIYKSITDYILYLKNNYGVEIALFSFNESDLGINIRQTAEEHLSLIKGLGAYFVSKGLKTKMLLGDNSDATTYKFIYPAMNDADARKYIGAISFHSWRGWETETLNKWADAAKKLNVPLIVGEGSIDAAAWNYPAVFEEQTYALEEINLYTRILSICQPVSILQWQLTADYSPLAGGGIFGNNDSLHPTQRFWNLKQLASTPKGLSAMPLSCNRPYLSCAALGNNNKGMFAIHIVNSGPERQVLVTGIPKNVKAFHIVITDKNRAMKELTHVNVKAGQLTFNADATSYITLVSK